MKSFTGEIEDSAYDAIIAIHRYLIDSEQIDLSLEEFFGVLAGLGLKNGGIVQQ